MAPDTAASEGPMTLAEARRVRRAPIKAGQRYTFHSTAMANKDVTPWSGQECVVIRENKDRDPEVERLWVVRFDDGHEATVFQGEINDFYVDSGQCVEAWRSDPVLAAQMARDAAEWAK